MKKYTRTLILGVSAIIALGTLSACSDSSEAPATETTAAFPASAKYIADMPANDGKTLTLGIAVDGDQVAAYACDGSTDEAWFFGDQTDGTIDITGKFRDTLRASFNGTDVVGDLTMNGVGYEFTAPAVAAPAGMYTAELNGVRSSWVVREDQSATGVQFGGGSGDDDDGAFEQQQLQDQEFRNSVRNKRLLQRAAPLGNMSSTINGEDVDAIVVTGNTRFN